MTRIGLTILLASIMASPGWASTMPTDQAARELTLDVFLDERRIGSQRFELQPTPTGLRVLSAATFEVRILGIKAFVYDHRNVEDWHGGCLREIRSSTNSNGRRYQVEGATVDGTLTVSTTGGSEQITECVGSFAYWDKAQLVSRQKLLNPQTGEYVPVQVTRQGEDLLRIDGRDLPVERYVISGKEIDITLTYALADGAWLALDSRVESGRILRYRRAVNEIPQETIAKGPL